MLIDWFDLPNLTTFTTGNASFIQDTLSINTLDRLRYFRNSKKDVSSSNSHPISFVDASLCHSCSCFIYNVVCSLSELNPLNNNIERLVIGNDCMQSVTSISFSQFNRLNVIDVGDNSLVKVISLSLSSSLIDDWLIWSS